MLHPDRVKAVINLSVPYPERGEMPWVEFMDAVLGEDFYFVQFNRLPGVADSVLEANAVQFLRNMFRKKVPSTETHPGLINHARAETPLGEPL